MCRSARRRGSAHRAHPRNHGDAKRWLVEGESPPLLDRLVIDRCIRALPTGAKRWASGNQPRSVNDLVELLENHQVTQRLCSGATPAPGGAGETRTERHGRTPESQRTQAPPSRAPAYPNQTIADRRGPAPPTQREEWRCYTCGQTGHLARHCPGAGDVSMPTASPSDRRGGVCLRTTCWSHEWTDTPSLPVRVGRHDTHALLDSGSVVTLVRPGLADGTSGRRIDVGCIHGQTESYNTRQITVQTPKGTFTVRAGLVPNLPMPLLIERDCQGPSFRHPGADHLGGPPIWPPTRRPPGPTRTSPPTGPRERRHAHPRLVHGVPSPGDSGHDDCLRAGPSTRRGGDSKLQPIDFSDYPLADGGGPDEGGQFATAQLEDDALRHAWGHVQFHEGLSRDSVSDRQYPHFSTRGGLLYRVVQRGGKEVEQLVIPRPYVSKVLYMAHTHLLGAHLGMDKTRDRILNRFYWVKRNVEDYCRARPECQRTAPRPTVRNPLIPMPLIEVPFDRLGLDIVGPLPRTSRGHRYVLVMVDYATRYPEAVPLRAATAKAAFSCLRRALCTEPLLITPDFNLPFVVHTDASEVGLGAVLSQVRSSEELPVTYISRKLMFSEKAYSTVEKEALAIKWTLEKLRYYLLGHTFTLVTDHAPLKWMATAKDTNARVTCWFLALQDYHFQVVHRPGRAHANADALSRRDACLGLSRGVPDLQLRVGVCGNPDPTEEFEPRQRPLRRRVVRGSA
ncbi:uncharacterized protein LOC132469424 [Gadus macrocephalus]|uniref:uncharacterized protein LOC132469424 n=1 Tax=Gadus macrocephalus TaxID=80720 RepID=UPI0028CB4ECA|nr:uncharacterized protein LOC132469424 [Gadus macrocephalus]